MFKIAHPIDFYVEVFELQGVDGHKNEVGTENTKVIEDWKIVPFCPQIGGLEWGQIMTF